MCMVSNTVAFLEGNLVKLQYSIALVISFLYIYNLQDDKASGSVKAVIA